PRQLYREPSSSFTASFIGSANLLPVTAGSGGAVQLGGTELKTAGATPAARGGATLCVRPHLLSLGEDGPNTLRGTVTGLQWRGATHRLTARVDGHEVHADLRELRDPPAPGDEVALSFAPEDGVLLHD